MLFLRKFIWFVYLKQYQSFKSITGRKILEGQWNFCTKVWASTEYEPEVSMHYTCPDTAVFCSWSSQVNFFSTNSLLILHIRGWLWKQWVGIFHNFLNLGCGHYEMSLRVKKILKNEIWLLVLSLTIRHKKVMQIKSYHTN